MKAVSSFNPCNQPCWHWLKFVFVNSKTQNVLVLLCSLSLCLQSWGNLFKLIYDVFLFTHTCTHTHTCTCTHTHTHRDNFPLLKIRFWYIYMEASGCLVFILTSAGTSVSATVLVHNFLWFLSQSQNGNSFWRSSREVLQLHFSFVRT